MEFTLFIFLRTCFYFPSDKPFVKKLVCAYWRACACKAVGPPWNQKGRSSSLIFPLRSHPSATPFGLPTYRGSISLDIRQAILFITRPAALAVHGVKSMWRTFTVCKRPDIIKIHNWKFVKLRNIVKHLIFFWRWFINLTLIKLVWN